MDGVVELFREYYWYQIVGVFVCLVVYDVAKRFAGGLIDRSTKKLEDELCRKRDDINFRKENLSALQSNYAELMLNESIDSVKHMYDYVEILAGQAFFITMMCRFDWRQIVKNENKEASDANRKLANHLIDMMKFDDNIIKLKNNKYNKGALFLSDEVISCVGICEAIYFHAYTTLTAISLGTTSLLKTDGAIEKQIEKADPTTVNGFNQFGEYYMYHLFSEYIQKSKDKLRTEIGFAKVTSSNDNLIKSIVSMVEKQKI